MQQIADWLKKLGLSEYAQRFAENHVDFSVLPELTDQDLKDLGIVLGDRRKLLRAIADLNGIEKIQSKPTEAATTPVAPQPQDSAERRQVSVMFADLVGSTALSARMDPEDLREIISAYQRCVTETVRRLGGFVAKYMGDGVLVYFGYPQAHEDDAERAVRAGLELIAAVSALKAPVSLQTRVGIATGLVVVGDLIGSGEAQERGIVGETPNLAARLQSIAEPNTVVMAESTRTLLGNLFELEDLGAKDFKGIARPVRAWAALRASSVASRFEALHTAGLTALVGREEELELLLRRWSRAKSGEGQVVLLSGEAGIGKSRLTASLMERLVSEPHTRLRYFCSPQHTDSAHLSNHRSDGARRWTCCTTTPRKRSSTSSMRCWPTPRPGWKTRHYSPRCCRSRMTDVIRRSICAATAQAENAGSAHRASGDIVAAKSRADDLRGCALDRSHEPGNVRSGRR